MLSNIVRKMSSITQRLSTGTVPWALVLLSHEITSQGARVSFRGGFCAGRGAGSACHTSIPLEWRGKPRGQHALAGGFAEFRHEMARRSLPRTDRNLQLIAGRPRITCAGESQYLCAAIRRLEPQDGPSRSPQSWLFV